MKLRYAGGREIGKAAGICIVHPDAQREHLPAFPDGMRGLLQRLWRDVGKAVFDVAEGRTHHIAIEPAQIAGFGNPLQPAQAVGIADLIAPERLAERRAEIFVALEPDLCRLGDLTHG
jgi:hypothetical protein